MKLKTRIFSTIMSMALALGVMTFAVYAAATQTLSVTNTVSFVSDHVLAHVTGQVEGAKVWDGGDVNWTYGKVTTTPTVNLNELDNWEIGHIDFFDENAPINIFILIENYSLERMFTFELVFNIVNDPEDTNINREVNYFNGYDAEYDLEDYIIDYDSESEDVVLQSYGNGQVSVQPSTAKIIVVTLGIANTGLSVNSFDNGFSITLLNEGEATEQPGGGDEEPGGEEPGEGNFVFNSGNGVLTILEPITLTEQSLLQMQVVGEPIFYGLYEKPTFATLIPLPYNAQPEDVFYAKTAEKLPFGLAIEPFDEDYPELGAFALATGSPDSLYSIEIPYVYNGYLVKEIADNGFYQNQDLKTITIPGSVKKIGVQAFEYCQQLTEVIMHNGVLDIGMGAFDGCFNLETIIIPDSVESIGTNALSGTQWFYDLYNDNNIEGQNNILYAGKVAIAVNLRSDTAFPLVFRPDTKGIGGAAFYMEWVYSIEIPASVTNIGEEAFWSGFVQEVTFASGSNLKHIGAGAFGDLVPYYIPNYDPELSEEEQTKVYSLTSIVLPNSLETIKENAFANTNLATITFSDSLVFVADDAFANTPWELAQAETEEIIVYAGSVAYIFNYDNFIAADTNEITIKPGTKAIQAYLFNEIIELESVILHYGLVSIGEYAFANTGLTSINLPSTVAEIGQSAFFNCQSLFTVTVNTNLLSYETVINEYGRLFFFATEIRVLEGVTLRGWMFEPEEEEMSDDYVIDESTGPDGYIDGPSNWEWDDELEMEVFVGFINFVDNGTFELDMDTWEWVKISENPDGKHDPIWDEDGEYWYDDGYAGWEDNHSMVFVPAHTAYIYRGFEPVDNEEGYEIWHRTEFLGGGSEE